MGERIVRELGMDMYTLLHLKREPARPRWTARGTLLHVMWQPGREGSRGRVDTGMCMAESQHRYSDVLQYKIKS